MHDDSLHWALNVCTSFADSMEFCSHSSVKKIKTESLSANLQWNYWGKWDSDFGPQEQKHLTVEEDKVGKFLSNQVQTVSVKM